MEAEFGLGLQGLPQGAQARAHVFGQHVAGRGGARNGSAGIEIVCPPGWPEGSGLPVAETQDLLRKMGYDVY